MFRSTHISRFRKVGTVVPTFFASVLCAASLFTATGHASTPTFDSFVGRGPNPQYNAPVGPVIADFNGDGFLDVLTADTDSSSFWISYGQADGNQNSSVQLTGPTNPEAIATADLNGDGKPDLLFVTAAGNIRYYLNDGTNPFNAFVDLPLPDISVMSAATDVSTGDFNGDGFPDIVAVGYASDGSGGSVAVVAIYLSTVDGSSNFSGYAAPVTFGAGALSVGDKVHVAIGDLNGDGYPDVAVTNTRAPADSTATDSGGGAVTYFFGDPTGTINNTPVLLGANEMQLQHHPGGITIGDVTQDGKSDIITSDYYFIQAGANTLTLGLVDVAVNNGDSATAPTFTSGHLFIFNNENNNAPPRSDVKLADIDGDGHNDIVVAQEIETNIHILRVPANLDANNYQNDDIAINPNGGGYSLAIADLNGDGLPDVVVAQGSALTALKNTTPPPVVEVDTVQFDQASSSAQSDGNTFTVNVTRTGSTSAVDVPLSFSGNAVRGSDYVTVPLTTTSVHFDAGSTTASITLDGNPHATATKTITITLGTPSGSAVLGSQSSTSISLNPATSGPTGKLVQFSKAVYSVDQTGVVDFIVQRGPASTGAVDVPFTFAGTALRDNGHNSATSEYVLDFPSNLKVHFNSGESQETIQIEVDSSGLKKGHTIIVKLGTPTPVGSAVLAPSAPVQASVGTAAGPTILHAANALTVTPAVAITLSKADKTAGYKLGGQNYSNWTFSTTQTLNATAAGLGLKVQYIVENLPSIVPSPTDTGWQDLDTMTLKGGKGTTWTLTLNHLPVPTTLNTVYFRTVTTATGASPVAGKGVGPVKVVPGPNLSFTISQAPQGASTNPNNFVTGGITTYNSDSIFYNIKIQNTGNAVATSAIAYIPVPVNMQFDTATTSLLTNLPAQQFDKKGHFTNNNGETVALQYVYANLTPGATDYLTVVMDVASAALFSGTKSTVSLIGYDITAKAQGINRLPGVPSTMTATVASPLEISFVASTSGSGANPTIAGIGATIPYEFTVTNHAGFAFNEAKFTNTVPVGTAIESVNLQDSNGNFVSTPPLLNPAPGGNPSVPLFQYGSQQLVTWTIGNIPAHGQKTIRYTVRVLYDLPSFYIDAAGVSHTTEVDNNSYNLVATPGTGGTVTAYKNSTSATPVRTLITAADPAALPDVRFEKRADGEGDGGGEVREVTNVGYVNVATVLPNDPVRYTLHFQNYGGSTARNCIIQDQVADGGTFTGFVGINGGTPSLNQYIFRKADGTLLPLPNHTLAQDITLAKILEFRVGDIAPGASGDVTYKVAATVPVNKYLVTNDCRMWTASLIKPVPGSPVVAPAKVVLPISYVIDTRPDKTLVHAGDSLTYTMTFNNNGGESSFNTVVSVPVPAGTTFASAQFLDQNLQPASGTIEAPSAANGNVCKFKVGVLNFHPADGAPDDPFNHGIVRMKVTVNSPLIASLLKPGAQIKTTATINGTYPKGAATHFRIHSRSLNQPLPADLSGAQLPGLPVLDPAFTLVQQGPQGPHLWGMKTYPQFVTKGQKILYRIVWGNSGTAPAKGITVGIQIPFGTTISAGDTTPGFKYDPKDKTIISWAFPDVPPHQANGCILVVTVGTKSVYADDVLEENSCYIATTDSPLGGVVPGPARTTVLSTSPIVAAWQGLGAILQGIGANLFGHSAPKLDSDVQQFSSSSINTTVRGTDVITLPNGALIIQNLGGNIVAQGGGNIVAQGGGNIVAQGGGNLVAQGGGNIVAQGGGNVITVAGVGLCTTANLVSLVESNIVAQGGGNIVAAGGGNVISNDGGSLINNDGASVISNDGGSFKISPNSPGLIDAGGGNIVAQGGGNIVAAGGGNIVAQGGGNLTQDLLSSKSGIVVIVNENGGGLISVGNNIVAQGGGNIVAQGGGNIVAQGGGNVIGNLTGGGLFSNAGAGIAPAGN